jgi:hypothetical protein
MQNKVEEFGNSLVKAMCYVGIGIAIIGVINEILGWPLARYLYY